MSITASQENLPERDILFSGQVMGVVGHLIVLYSGKAVCPCYVSFEKAKNGGSFKYVHHAFKFTQSLYLIAAQRL